MDIFSQIDQTNELLVLNVLLIKITNVIIFTYFFFSFLMLPMF